MDSNVFEHFPKLKLIVPHGGGAIPYHMGRFRAWAVRNGGESFDDKLQAACTSTPAPTTRMRSSCCSRSSAPTACCSPPRSPGTGSARDPMTGRDYDDLKPVIEAIAFLTDEDRRNVFECNCTRLYTASARTSRRGAMAQIVLGIGASHTPLLTLDRRAVAAPRGGGLRQQGTEPVRRPVRSPTSSCWPNSVRAART